MEKTRFFGETGPKRRGRWLPDDMGLFGEINDVEGGRNMQGQFSPMPTAEKLRASHAAYERVEPRSLFYRLAVKLVESAWRDQSSLSLAETVAVLLQTWN